MINAFNLGQNIKFYINGDIKKFADKINYDYEDLVKIIDGRRLVRPVDLYTIANELAIDPELLLKDNSGVKAIRYRFDDADMIINIIDDYIEVVERNN